jgi:recombination protein U
LYYLTYKKLYEFWQRSVDGGRKSFRFDELDESFILPHKSGILVPYLDMINQDLNARDEEE